MKKLMWALFLFLGSSAFKGSSANAGNYMELTGLKVSLMYVRSIKTFRLLFMSLFSMGMCLIFLLIGLIVLHISLFLYTPWSMGTKMLIGLSCASVYLIATVVMISQTFASDKWLKIFNAEGLINQLNKEIVPKEDAKPIE